MLKPHLVHQAYTDMYGDRLLENLTIPTILQTTDGLSGKPVTLTSGLLSDAVYASGALFPLLPPININGRLLMDGVYSTSLPVMEAVKRDTDIIIAMTYEERTTVESKSFVSYFMRNMGYSQNVRR